MLASQAGKEVSRSLLVWEGLFSIVHTPQVRMIRFASMLYFVLAVRTFLVLAGARSACFKVCMMSCNKSRLCWVFLLVLFDP